MADEVSIPVHLLESVKQTVTTAFYASQTMDLAESYRKLQNAPKWSPMTTKLSQHVELLQSFIDLAEADEEEDEPPGPTD